MPAAASSTGRPSFTNANAKISTHATAKNNVVVSTSQLFASIATSFRSTSHAVRKNMSVRPYQRSIPRAQPGRCGLVGYEAAVANQCHARHEAVSQIEIVRGEHHDRAVRRQHAKAIGDQADRAIVETGERLV